MRIVKFIKNLINFLQKKFIFKYDIVAPIIATALVLASGTFISFMVAQNQANSNDSRKDSYVDQQMQLINDGISQRLRAYEQVIIAGSSLIKINGNVTHEQWKNFIDGFSIEQEIFTGNSIGFVRKVPAGNVSKFEKKLHEDGFPEASIFPDSDRDVYYAVEYIEPQSDFTPQIIGYDLYSDSTRREIAAIARDTGKLALTPPLAIPNSQNSDETSVVALFPVYSQMASLNTIEERRQSIQGYTFIAINTKDMGDWLYKNLLDESEQQAIRLIDVTDTDNPSELYSSPNYTDLSKSSSITSNNLSVLGRQWQLEFALRNDFSSNLVSPLLIFTFGMLVNAASAAFLFVLMIHRQSRIAMSHEQQVQQAKDDLLALASHQLRTPATGVKQYVGMVLAGYAGGLTEEQEMMLKKADESNERQLEIINQLLYVAKADAGQLKVDAEKFNITDVMQQVIDEQSDHAESREIRVRFKKPRAIGVISDERHIRMILENLLSNAIKYSPPGKVVDVYFNNWRDRVAVHVTDRGVGISQADQDQLFKKFSRIDNRLTRRVGGSGIGLFLSQQLAQANQGEIIVKSELNKGSTFTLHLPKRPKK